MFNSYFYLEHVNSQDTDFWVQWLYEDGTGHPDIDNYEADLWIGQNGTTIAIPTTEVDVPASAFRFHISDGHTYDLGTFDCRITTQDTDQVTSQSIYRQIAVGTIHIIEGTPN